MMNIEMTPLYTIGLPLAAFFCSWVVSKALRVSLVGTLLAACLPLALPFMDLPFAESVSVERPEYLIGGGWVFLGALLSGWVFVRPALTGSLQGVGVIKLIYLAILAGALGVVGVLLVNPPVLDQYVPGWHGTAGIVLLCASLLSMALALARVVRAAFVFAVWAFVSIILASEVFLQKLPHDIVREDLRSLVPLIPLREIDSVLQHLSIRSSDAPDALRAFIVSGSAAAGYPLAESERVASHLGRLFERSGIKAEVSDVSLPGASVYEQKELLPKLLKAKPDLVVIVGWGSDSERGTNSYGIPGMTESEARSRISRLAHLQEYPLVKEVLSSSLYRYLAAEKFEQQSLADIEALSPRVAVDAYEEILSEVVAAYQKAGVRVVLATEPFVRDEEASYRDAMERAARRSGAAFIETGRVITGRPLLVSRGRLLSKEGCKVIAQATVDALIESDGGEPQSSQAGSTPESLLGGKLTQVLASNRAELSVRDRQTFLGSLGDTERGDPLRMLVRPSEIDGDLLFKVKIRESGTRFYRVVFSVNGEFVADRRLDAREATRVRFQLPESYRSLPYVELELRTVASPPADTDRIKGSDVYALVPIASRSMPDQPAIIEVAGDAMHATERFFASSVDYRSGQRVSSVRSDDGRVFARWVMQQPWGNLIVGQISQGRENQGSRGWIKDGISVTATVRTAFGSIGVPEKAISEIGRTTFIGVSGVKNAQARVVVASEADESGSSLTIGGEVTKAYTKFIVEDISVGGKPLKTYGSVQL